MPGHVHGENYLTLAYSTLAAGAFTTGGDINDDGDGLKTWDGRAVVAFVKQRAKDAQPHLRHSTGF